MRARLFPVLVGLSIAAIFIFTKSIVVVHFMFLIAASILYKEIIDIFVSASPDEQRQHKFFSRLGHLAILTYTTVQTITSLNANAAHELLSLYHLGIILVAFAILSYLYAIFTAQSNATSSELAPARQKALTQSLHALLYTLFFLYTIVKIKLGLLFIPSHFHSLKESMGALIFIWSLVWIYDSVAYICGTKLPETLTRHKLGITISAQKSWIGLIGGVSSIALGSALVILVLLPSLPQNNGMLHAALLYLVPASPWWSILLWTLLLSLTAQIGDLIASFFKRAAHKKDAGTIFGSHGGFLDRNDSALFAFAGSYYLLLLLA